MKTVMEPSRREFLKKISISTAALTISMLIPGTIRSVCSAAAKKEFQPNVWLRVLADNTAVIQFAEAEMGQGTMTALPMILADELEMPWEVIRVKVAGHDPAYGDQSTGGSTSIRQGWPVMRHAGATAREIFLAAAAARWGVPKADCIALEGQIIYEKGNRRVAYGDLLETAASLPIPTDVPLKDPENFRLIGTSVPRIDARDKVTGRAQFGVDVRLDGLLHATVIRCPVFGGRVRSYSDQAAKKLKGVVQVLNLDDRLAVVGKNQWWALEGARVLEVDWDYAGNERVGSDSIYNEFRNAAASEEGSVALSRGDAVGTLASASKVIEAEYLTPYQAHATMEPMSCTATVASGRCEVWAPTQDLGWAHATAAAAAFSKTDRLVQKIKGRLGFGDPVTVHRTLLGGGFGRRLRQDYVADAVQISRLMKAPVTVMWSRTEDMQHDFYHPATLHRMAASVGEDGLPTAWQHRVAGDGVSALGADTVPYSVPNLKVSVVSVNTPVPTGPWRGVGHVYNAFAVECFIDELARAGGWDPVDYRLRLLAHAPRLRHLTEVAAEYAGWGRSLYADHARGFAIHEGFGSAVAQIAEVRIDKGLVRVPRITCVVDCGTVINPDTVTAQMEGAIAFGLTAVLKSAVSIRDGRVEQRNFHDFPLLTMSEMPEVSVHIIASRAAPGGIGEPGVPPVAPAVANAVFAATGKPMRRLPISAL